MGKLAVALSLIALVMLVILVFLHPAGWAFAIGVHPAPPGTPWTYQLWSGFVPAMAILSLAGNLVTLWRIHTCAARWCIRLTAHTSGGRGWCERHWPAVKPERTYSVILEEILGELKSLRE